VAEVTGALRAGSPAGLLRHWLTCYLALCACWVRAAWGYRGSFWTLMLGSFLLTGIDFAAIAIAFGTAGAIGGFELREVALLYGLTGVGLGVADTLIGSVERIGTYIRTGTLDQMLTRPVPVLVQVCADQFTLRRLGRITQAAAVLAWGCTAVDWDAGRVGLLALTVASGSVIFLGLFIGCSSIQFWTTDSSEFANAFTYGGSTLTQYPLTILPREVLLALTFLLPVAFVNWYPALYLLGRQDPFGLPTVVQFAAPLAAVWVVALALSVWRTGLRRYTSTGS